MPVRNGDKKPAQQSKITEALWEGAYYLPVGGLNCIVIRVKDRDNTKTPARPAYIEIGKVGSEKDKPICKEVLDAEPIKAYLNLQVPNVTPIEKGGAGVIVFEPSVTIY